MWTIINSILNVILSLARCGLIIVPGVINVVLSILGSVWTIRTIMISNIGNGSLLIILCK